jgi:hypothetical protein
VGADDLCGIIVALVKSLCAWPDAHGKPIDEIAEKLSGLHGWCAAKLMAQCAEAAV